MVDVEDVGKGREQRRAVQKRGFIQSNFFTGFAFVAQ